MSSNAANEQVICKNGKVAFKLISFIIEIGGGGYVEKIVVEQFWKRETNIVLNPAKVLKHY